MKTETAAFSRDAAVFFLFRFHVCPFNGYVVLCSHMDRTYNVLMIAPTSFFRDYGCHVRILEEALILRKLGHEITIATYHNGEDLRGLNIQRTIPIPGRENWEVGSSRHKIGFDVLLSLKSLELALRHKYDVIHAHLHEGALIGWPLSLLRGIPLIFDFQGSLTGEMIDHHFLNPDGKFYRPLRWLEEFINSVPQAILTSSTHAANLLSRDFGCAEEKIVPIPDCVNADTFRPRTPADAPRIAELKGYWGIPLDRKVVVYLGVLADYQGTPHLLQAAARLIPRFPKLHFLIMGYPGVDIYRQMAANLGIADHVTFTGRVQYRYAPGHLMMGDIAVAPKLSATEGSGKILNYMAMGLPTVTFDTPVSHEYLSDWGYYASRGDVNSLAEQIAELVTNEERAQTVGKQLRMRAQELYSWNRAVHTILQVYEQAIAIKQKRFKGYGTSKRGFSLSRTNQKLGDSRPKNAV